MDRKSTTYWYSENIQKKIAAMFLFDEEAFVSNFEIIELEYFDNPCLNQMALLQSLPYGIS